MPSALDGFSRAGSINKDGPYPTREKIVMEKLIKFRLGRKVRNRLTNLIEKEITPFEQKRTKSNYVHSSDVANWKQQIKDG